MALRAKTPTAGPLAHTNDEIVPYEIRRGRREATVTQDESPRADTTLAALARLRPVFGGPLVTAANAPGQNVGACFIVLASSAAVQRLGLSPLARVRSAGSIARAPREIAVAPAPAIAAALASLGWELEELDLLEINEAFACVPLTAVRVLADSDQELEARLRGRLNVHGGAVAIGHPPGASGARLLLTLARGLRARGGRRGVASICGGLGQGDAATLELF